MRTPWLIAIVAAVHCVAVGSVFLIQGCGTARLAGSPPPPEMPEPLIVERMSTLPSSAPPPAPRAWPSETSVYVVGKGDSLSGIAAKYGLSVSEISALNNISDPNKIRAGQKLVLPGKVDLDAPRSTKKAPTPSGGNVYVVKAGDTLSGIAKSHGLTTADLVKANNLASANMIRVNQKLVIPGAVSGAELSDPAPMWSETTGFEPTEPMDDVAPMHAPAPPAVDGPAEPAGVGLDATVYRTHTVEADEDLYSVAMMWGVGVAELKKLNNLEGTELTTGQQLKIPLPGQ